jgi:wee1-like protein kinase
VPADQQPSSKRRPPTVIPVPPVMPSRFKMDFDDPVRIGQGNFSIVWRARSRLDGALYAIKQLKQPFDGAKRRERMLREVCAFAALPNCPFLVKYHGCWVEENALHIVTEFCQGHNLEHVMLGLGLGLGLVQTAPSRQQVPLFDSGSDVATDSNESSEVPIFSHIQAVQAGRKPSRLCSVGSEHDDPDIIDVTPPPKRVGHKIEEPAAWKMLYCVSSALAHMHEKGIAHLDVRPANMFQDGDYVKLGDLGNAAALDEKDDISEGEERYIPRELVDSEGSTLDLAKADVFSLGASLYELCLGRDIASAGEEWHAIRDGDLCTAALSAYSEKLQHLTRRMLDAVPSRRPTAEEIVALAAQELLQQSVKSASPWRADSIQSMLLRSFIEQAGFSG